MPGALLTDLYELNMASSFLRHHMTGQATFSLFVRRLPPERGFLVAAGVEDCLDWLEQFSFEPADLDYLGSLGYDAPTLEAFGELGFTGDVFAVPEGRIVFANEPILEVSAPIAEAQLVETYLLNRVSLQTTLATKAARCVVAAAGRIELVEFGFRRTHGTETGCDVARLSNLVGFSGTSNVEAARRYGLEAKGTMAHSYVEAFANEADAFLAFAGDLPGGTTFLVDTYDTLDGVRHAIEVICKLGIGESSGIRLDSGDLARLAVASRRLLDEAGLEDVRIFVSGGLDEHDLEAFVAEGVPVDAAGVGTRLGVSADAPFLDTAYKLVEYDGRPVAKLSTGKATLPGPKQVMRAPGLEDTIARRREEVPAGTSALLEPLMLGGRRVASRPPLEVGRALFAGDLAELPRSAARLVDPLAPVARVSRTLAELAKAVREEHRPRS